MVVKLKIMSVSGQILEDEKTVAYNMLAGWLLYPTFTVSPSLTQPAWIRCCLRSEIVKKSNQRETLKYDMANLH